MKTKSLTWQQIKRCNFTNLYILADYLNLSAKQKEKLIKHPFPLNLPYRLAAKITKGTLDDPILRQFVPLDVELEKKPGFTSNPLLEQSHLKTSKLIHKYHGRALLLTSSACAMHCRYCFRRAFPYEREISGFENEIDLIAKDDTLSEIILSGGDPLSLSDERLKNLNFQLGRIPHLKRIRFHSRFPVGIPERITDELLDILKTSAKQIIFVTHINHPKELDTDVLLAFSKIQKLGIPVLNQAVLLKGVNSYENTLQRLFEKLSDHGILPYYLHQLDRVEGAHHFEVPVEEGKKLMKSLRKKLSGYALPTYAQDVSGAPSKIAID